jgi:hypothetical protein
VLLPRRQANLAGGAKVKEHAMSKQLSRAIAVHAMSKQLSRAIAVIGIDIGKNSFHV